MKKRIVWIVSLSVIVLLAGAGLIFFLSTKGRVYTADGLVQNDRCYIDFAYVDNDTVYYTLINDTCHTVMIGDKPTVEKKIDGEWQMVFWWQSVNEIAIRVPPFSRTQKHFEIDTWVEEPVGEYRLRFGSEPSIVGYFEITEAMRERVTDHRIYRKDGLLQTELVQLKEVRLEQNELCFTALNLLDCKMEFSSVALIQKKEGEIWTTLCAKQPKGFEVAANSESTHRIAVGALDVGEYRCIYAIERSFAYWMPETDPETGEKRYPLHEQAVYAVGCFAVS